MTRKLAKIPDLDGAGLMVSAWGTAFFVASGETIEVRCRVYLTGTVRQDRGREDGVIDLTPPFPIIDNFGVPRRAKSSDVEDAIKVWGQLQRCEREPPQP